jgi:hypothetical protein
MTDMDAIQNALAGMDDTYENTTDGRPEDGDYQAVIQRFDFFEGKDGSVYLKTELRIAHDPLYEGWEAEAIHNLTDAKKLTYTKKYLTILEYDGKLSELPARIGDYVGVPVDITIKRSDRINSYDGLPYLNVFINRKLGDSDIPSDTSAFKSPASPLDDSDPIPF